MSRRDYNYLVIVLFKAQAFASRMEQVPRSNVSVIQTMLLNCEDQTDVCKIFVFKKDTDDANPTDCPICLETISRVSWRQLAMCNHTFHVLCINKWFQESRSTICPLCRQQSCIVIGRE